MFAYGYACDIVHGSSPDCVCVYQFFLLYHPCTARMSLRVLSALVSAAVLALVGKPPLCVLDSGLILCSPKFMWSSEIHFATTRSYFARSPKFSLVFLLAAEGQLPPDHIYIAGPRAMSYSNAKQWAQSQTRAGVQGHLLTASSKAELDRAFQLLETGGTFVPGFWLAISDAASEGNWVYDHGPEQGAPALALLWWNLQQPLGGTSNNCARMSRSLSRIRFLYALEALPCSSEAPFVVEFECPINGQHISYEFNSEGTCVGMKAEFVPFV